MFYSRRLLESDAIVRYYGLQKGQVVKITSSDGVVDPLVNYFCKAGRKEQRAVCYYCHLISLFFPFLNSFLASKMRRWDIFFCDWPNSTSKLRLFSLVFLFLKKRKTVVLLRLMGFWNVLACGDDWGKRMNLAAGVVFWNWVFGCCCQKPILFRDVRTNRNKNKKR